MIFNLKPNASAPPHHCADLPLTLCISCAHACARITQALCRLGSDELRERNDHAAAKACFREALALRPMSHAALRGLADAHMRHGISCAADGHHSDAVREFKRALQRRGGQLADAHHQMGRAFEAQGKPREAKAAYTMALEQDQRCASFAKKLYMGYPRALPNGSPKGPLISQFSPRFVCREIADTRPLLPLRSLDEARFSLRALTAKLDETTSKCNGELKNRPRDSELWFKLGITAVASGRTIDGAQAFQRCLEQNPKHAGALQVVEPKQHRTPHCCLPVKS